MIRRLSFLFLFLWLRQCCVRCRDETEQLEFFWEELKAHRKPQGESLKQFLQWLVCVRMRVRACARVCVCSWYVNSAGDRESDGSRAQVSCNVRYDVTVVK